LQLTIASTTPRTAHGRTDGRRNRRTFAVGLGLIALVGFGIRLGYALAGGAKDVSYDGIYYYLVGKVLADGDGYVNPFNGVHTALHAPAWPVVLGLPSAIGLDTLLSQQVFACVVGTATIVLVGITARVIAGCRVGLIAAAIAAAYPNLWVRERELAAETLVFPVAAVVLALAYRYLRAPRTVTLLALGAACGVLILIHSAMVLLLVLLVPAVALRAQSGGSAARRLARLVAALGVAGVILLPWVVRNTVRFERPVLLTTNLGLTLRAGNCPAAYEGARLGSFDIDLVRPATSVAPGGCVGYRGSGDESEQDAVFRDQALRYMREHATRVPAVVAAREGRTWGLFRPFQQSTLERESGHGPLGVYQLAVFAYWALLPLAVAGAVRLRQRSVPLFPLLLFLAAVALVVGVTIGSVRYRAAAEVPIVVLAAIGVDALWGRRRSRDVGTRRDAATTMVRVLSVEHGRNAETA
jgi:Dolichyl-phosphate-mannose-protein mannosyltransferase